MQKAIEDIEAVITATSATNIFGHSAGALIALETSLKNTIKKLAVYEPPISVNHSFPLDWVSDFEKALADDKRKKAMAISLKGLNIIDGMGKMPLWSIELLINTLALAEREKAQGTRMVDLIPTLLADIKMVEALESTVERYQNVHIPVSLMAGSKSPAYFHFGLNALANNIKQSAIKIFDNHGHNSPEDAVSAIATHLKCFFKNDALQ